MHSEATAVSAAQPDAHAVFLGLLRAIDEEPSEDRPERDYGDLTQGGRNGEDQDGGDHRQCPLRSRSGHNSGSSPRRPGRQRHSDCPQAAEPGGVTQVPELAQTIGEQDEHHGGWQREPAPGGECARQACAEHAEADAYLTAGRAGQELAEGDDVGVVDLAQPASAFDELRPEVADMGHRTAEACEA